MTKAIDDDEDLTHTHKQMIYITPGVIANAIMDQKPFNNAPYFVILGLLLFHIHRVK